MKILIACEESQTITKEYRKLGFEAYSCDVLDCSGGHPEWHIKGDAIKEAYSGKYDLMIAHPPCTYLAVSGNRWLYNKDKTKNKERWKNRELALDFVRELMNAPIKKIAIENPTPMRVFNLPKHTMVIQPYQFGHSLSKKTLLWLKNLPNLKPDKDEPMKKSNNYKPLLPSNTGGKKFGLKYSFSSITGKESSITFKGIANAMVKQWG